MTFTLGFSRIAVMPMARRAAWVVAALAFLPAPGEVSGQDKKKSELEGRWALKSAQDGDGVLKPDKVLKFVLVVEGGQMFHEKTAGKKDEGRPFKLDAGKNPKWIDFKSEGKKKDQDRVGIYAVEGDKLRICFSTVVPVDENRRPTEFTTPPGSGRVLLEFERVKK